MNSSGIKEEALRVEQFFKKAAARSAKEATPVAVYFAVDGKEAAEQFENNGWTATEARAAEMALCGTTMKEFAALYQRGFNLAGVFTNETIFPFGQKFLVVMEEGLRRFKEYCQQPNYIKKFTQLAGQRQLELAPGTISDVLIAHDDHCDIFRGGTCNCDPDIAQFVGGSDEERVKRIAESARNFTETVRKKRL